MFKDSVHRNPLVLILQTVILIIFSSFSMLSSASTSVRFTPLEANQSLSQNTVSTITQDTKGYLWIGTQDGLNRYDGINLKSFKPNSQKSDSISDSFITTSLTDGLGRLWIGTRKGLNRFDHEQQQFIRYDTQNGLSHEQITSLFEGPDGAIFVGTMQGLSYLPPNANRFKSVQTNFTKELNIRSMASDQANNIWVATQHGLFLLNNFTLQVVDLPNTSGASIQVVMDIDGTLYIGSERNGLYTIKNNDVSTIESLSLPLVNGSTSSINSLYLDPNGNLWIGTSQGLFIKNKVDNSVSHYVKKPGDPFSISGDHVTSIFEDRSGVIWVGTLLNGLNKHVLAQQAFSHYYQEATNPLYRLDSNATRAILAMPNGEFWVGTDNGLHHFDVNKKLKSVLSHNAYNNNSLSGNRIWALAYDDAQNSLWIGTFKSGLNRLDLSSNQVTRYNHDDKNPNSLSSDRIRSLFVGENSTLYIGTWGGGLNSLKNQSSSFTQYTRDMEKQKGLTDNRVIDIVQVDDEHMLLATMNGLNTFNLVSKEITSFPLAQGTALSDERISSMKLDRNGKLWLATRQGLDVVDINSGSVNNIQSHGILQDEVVYAVELASKGEIWASTNRGLFRFDSLNNKFSHYTQADGLQANEFNTRSSSLLSDGSLVFGGVKGFNIFHPENLKPNLQPPQIVFNDLLLFNESVLINADNGLLSSSIDSTTKLTLNHKQSMLTIDFAALHFVDPKNNRYHYKLDGFDSNWITADATRLSATYTNLDSGEYAFRIKAANKDGVQAERESPLKISVLPAPWRTWWAYSLYAILILSIIAMYIRTQKQKLAHEREVNSKLRALDKMKDEFLANTSHELRTPLNGMIGLADSMIGEDIPEHCSNNLEMIVKSGRRLNQLVNNILTFSKQKESRSSLKLEPVNLAEVINQVVTLSRHEISNKPVRLIQDIDENLPMVLASEHSLHQILHNLVNNAVKFTHHGNITLSAQVRNNMGSDVVHIEVSDTGIGIAEDKHALVFEPFQQADGSTEREYGGTGLGLTLTKQLLKLHGSEINLQSVVNQGSTFSFDLAVTDIQAEKVVPVCIEGYQALSDFAKRDQISNYRTPKAATAETNNFYIQKLETDKQFTILIVDDEPINRQVLKNYLVNYNFILLEAQNGIEAVSLVQQRPEIDLLLLDIMMPSMSGYDVCKELRKIRPLNDLPILFLTAKTQIDDVVEGFANGGNDFLIKPVAKYELQSRVQTHLQLLDISRDLEAKVKERTEELVALNASLKDAYSHLKNVSNTDPLTGLFNRRYFMQRIETDIAQSDATYAKQRQLDKTPRVAHNSDIVFYMIDLDHFKHVNDTYGHAAGDAVLLQVCDILKSVLREDDYVVRWGGEEFLVVARHSDRKFAPQLAERFRQSIEAHTFIVNDNIGLKKTASIGYAAYPFALSEPDKVSWQHTIDIADLNLYAAKHSQRNAWIGVEYKLNQIEENYLDIFSCEPKKSIENSEIEVFSSIKDINSIVWS